MKKSNADHFYRAMLTLAIPIALQNMLSSCASLVDTAMVARLGDVATSAAGVGGRVMMMMDMVTFGFCSGGSVLISQYWGAKDMKGVRRSYSVGLLMSCFVALLFTLGALLFPYQLMCVFTDEEAIRAAGAEYIRIVAIGVVPLTYASIANMARRSVEDVKVALYTSTTAVAINTFLNYCLIYGHFGMPRLGLNGAAWATTISHIIQAVLVFAIGVRQKHFTVYGLSEAKNISKAFLAKYFRIAMPVVLNESLWGICFNGYAMIYARQGSSNYAAYTLYGSIENLVFVFFIGACNACGILIGKAIGEGKKDEVQVMARKTLLTFVIMGMTLGGCLYFLRWPILNLVGVKNAETAALTAKLLAFYSFWCPIRQMNYVLVVGILRAGGDTRISALIDVCVPALWGVPITWLLAYVWKAPFFWLVCGGCFMAEDLLKLPLCLRRLSSGKWIRSLVGEEDAQHGL